jgi:hypothetical protein
MDQKTCRCEVFVIVDEDGDYSVGADQDSASEHYVDNYGGDVRRVVRIVLEVPLPTIIELTGTVPPEGTSATLTVSQ